MKLTNKTIGLKSEDSIAAGATLDIYVKPVRISSTRRAFGLSLILEVFYE